MTKVLLVSYHFPPSSAVGALRPGRLARLLPEFGYEVSVVCADCGDGESRQDPTRLGMVPDGAQVVRVDSPYVMGRNPFRPIEAGRPLRRLWWKSRAYLEWFLLTADWSWRWGQEAARASEALLEAGDIDLVIADGPPHASVVPVIRTARDRGVPIVLDLRDIWIGEQATGFQLRAWADPEARRRHWRSRLREEAVRGAAHVVLTSPAMARVTRAWFPDLPDSRFSCVTNGFGEVDGGAETQSLGQRSGIRIVYAGSLAYGRSGQASSLLKGLSALRQVRDLPLEVLFLGEVDPSLKEVAVQEEIGDMVTFRGWVDTDLATELQRGADALLLLQPPNQIETEVAIPGKLFDYMARRKHVLAMVGPGPAADLVKSHDLGVVVSSEDPAVISQALMDLATRVGERPVLPPPPEEYSERATVAAFARILDQVVGKKEA